MASEAVVNVPPHVTTYFFSRSDVPSMSYRIRLFLRIYWKSLLVVLTPILLLPLPILRPTPDYKCMYVVLIMAAYWVTEALPLPVTSMIPIVLFPTMGILDSDKTCQAYMKETNMMFLGGLMIAAGVQHSKLPKRLALKTIQLVGCSHKRLNVGLTFVTMFISMWVSNAAATTMMVPIVEGVLEVLEQQGLGDRFVKKKKENMDNGANGKQVVEDDSDEPPVPTDTTVCYYLSIAFAASIGGIGTIVGSATNPTFKGIYESRFPKAPPVDFLRWMMYNVPCMLLMQVLIWIWLQVLYMGMFRPNSEAAKKTTINPEAADVTKKIIDSQYKSLGPMTFHEKSAGVLFILAVFLYIFRSPGFMLGWADVLTTMKVKDGVTSIIIVIIMFVVPMAPEFLKVFTAQSFDEMPTKPSSGVVTWGVLKEKIPWGLLFLLGGGFALAEGSKASQMSKLIGDSLASLEFLPPYAILFLIVLATEFLTEFTSNVAIANIILPVLAEMAIAIKVHPLFFMLPAAIACSMAFHMPVGTPPNAIVAGVAHIPTSKMAVGGIGPTILTTIIVWGAFPTWGLVVYPDTASLPDWATH